MSGDGNVLRPDGLARLAATVARMPPPVFAIVDGGHFDDLPSDLSAAGLMARSLFLGHGARDVERHGPWFVTMRDTGDTGDVGAVLGIVGELPAAVFWSCPDGDVALYGHLRRLNMARIPAWAAAGKIGPEPGSAGPGYETVLFRHWDPRVLGALMPVLDEEQFGRILGPAGEIAFHTEDHGGIRRVVNEPEWPTAPSGLLTISPDQIGALLERRISARRSRICKYLRDVTGHALDNASAADVYRHVLHSEATANELGVVTEAGHCRWAYLMYATQRQVAQKADIKDQIRNSPKGPDVELSALMKEALRHLRNERVQMRVGS